MRRFLPLLCLLMILPLAACTRATNQAAVSTPTLSPVQMQTQIAQVLTEMPANGGQTSEPGTPAGDFTPGPDEAGGGIMPTEPAILEPTAQPPAQEPTAEPTATVEVATATVAPEPTEAAAATSTPTVFVLPTATIAPAPTFTPSAGDPRTRLGAPASTDPMDNSTTWFWPTGSDKYTSVNFTNGTMAVSALTDTDGWRMANPKNQAFGNIYLEGTFTTTTCSGSDHYGMILRVPDSHDPNQGYLFGVTCDGRYSLRRWDGEAGTKGEMKWLVNWTANSAIASGTNKTNRLGIYAVGSRLILYANGALLTEVNDALFSNGYFGVFVGSDQTDDLTVSVDEMSYWENPNP